MKLLTVAFLLSISASVFADQCAWVNHATAQHAKKEFLKRGTTIAKFCEPCGETAPTIVRVRSSSVQRINDSYSQVKVNGQGVDLAYVYTLVNGTRFYNVAGLVGCDAQGVTFDFVRQ